MGRWRQKQGEEHGSNAVSVCVYLCLCVPVHGLMGGAVLLEAGHGGGEPQGARGDGQERRETNLLECDDVLVR